MQRSLSFRSVVMLGFIVLFLVAGCSSTATLSPDQLSHGKQVYEQQCLLCHGANGVGQYPQAYRNRDPQGLISAPPHNGDGHTWHHPDAQLFEVVKNGRFVPGLNPMPGFSAKLNDEEIWAVLAYIKTWWTPEQLRQQAIVSAEYTPRAPKTK